MKDKIIKGFAWLQVHNYRLRESAKNKDGQAILEYALIFFIAGLGLALALAKYQYNAESSLQRQASQLSEIGPKLF